MAVAAEPITAQNSQAADDGDAVMGSGAPADPSPTRSVQAGRQGSTTRCRTGPARRSPAPTVTASVDRRPRRSPARRRPRPAATRATPSSTRTPLRDRPRRRRCARSRARRRRSTTAGPGRTRRSAARSPRPGCRDAADPVTAVVRSAALAVSPPSLRTTSVRGRCTERCGGRDRVVQRGLAGRLDRLRRRADPAAVGGGSGLTAAESAKVTSPTGTRAASEDTKPAAPLGGGQRRASHGAGGDRAPGRRLAPCRRRRGDDDRAERLDPADGHRACAGSSAYRPARSARSDREHDGVVLEPHAVDHRVAAASRPGPGAAAGEQSRAIVADQQRRRRCRTPSGLIAEPRVLGEPVVRARPRRRRRAGR